MFLVKLYDFLTTGDIMTNFNDLKRKLDNRWPLFEKIHKEILSINPNIKYRIFPIYVSYYIGDKAIAVIFFKTKIITDNQLNIGFAFKKNPNKPRFINADHMNYKGINYSIILNTGEGITDSDIKTIRESLCVKG